MQKTLDIVNAMEASGVIARYALTGAVAAIYYTEPGLTEDVDLLIALDATSSQDRFTGLLTLAPIIDHLNALGYREGIVVESWPVQFLPVANPLDAEALANSHEVEIDLPDGKTASRVLRAEHLIAIALRTGRPKDFVRIIQLLDANAADETALKETLERHGLAEQWERFCHRHDLGGDNFVRA